jgi:hypothetical protein
MSGGGPAVAVPLPTPIPAINPSIPPVIPNISPVMAGVNASNAPNSMEYAIHRKVSKRQRERIISKVHMYSYSLFPN